MKRLRLQRWSGQLLAARPGAAAPSAAGCPSRHPGVVVPDRLRVSGGVRHHSAAVTPNIVFEDGLNPEALDDAAADAKETTTTTTQRSDVRSTYPSPLPEQALRSAKLAALHARLSLSTKIPLQTLARALVDRTADAHPQFNNSNLAFLGYTLINYHVCEWLMCRYPRLPMMIVYAAMKSFAGPSSLHQIARQWGVESAAAPGDEVDPGLLQFDLAAERSTLQTWGYQRPETKYKFRWRHGISSRVVMDDDFGDMAYSPQTGHALPSGSRDQQARLAALDVVQKREFGDQVHADFVRAVVGAIFAHCGREAAKSFVTANVLSRQLDFSRLMEFKRPTKELAYLCARENFEPPVARLLSETGRLSISPVFVVGIYSGKDKLGEGAAASLDAARMKAAINALKSWYLYSPGDNVRVPSDMLVNGAKPWEPAYVDIGEIID